MNKLTTLVDNWRAFPKMWSVRLQAAAIALYTAILADPTMVAAAWSQVPETIRALLPAHFVQFMPVILMIIGLYARIVKQEKISG